MRRMSGVEDSATNELPDSGSRELIEKQNVPSQQIRITDGTKGGKDGREKSARTKCRTLNVKELFARLFNASIMVLEAYPSPSSFSVASFDRHARRPGYVNFVLTGRPSVSFCHQPVLTSRTHVGAAVLVSE